MKLAVLGCALLLSTVPASAAAPCATVHLFRDGAGRVGISTFVDGHEVFKIGENKVVSFTLQPGYHEVSVKFGGDQPAVALQVKEGGEYFVHLRVDVRKSALFTGGGPNAVAVNLSREDGIPNQENYQQQPLGSDKLAELAASSMPQGVPAAPPPDLQYFSDDEVSDAILQGARNNNPAMIGLYLEDVQMNVISHTVASGAYANSGFSVWIYTPSKWIAYQASIAHRLMKPFAISDVTPEMRAKVLHVVALPKVPDRLDAAGMSAASSVARVVLTNHAKTQIIQPINEQPDIVRVNSALRSMDYTEVASDFNMVDVGTIRATDKKGEFFIVVIGEDGSRKYFDVKQKDAAWL